MEKQYTIYVYGFDRIGFDIKEIIRKNIKQFNIYFIPFEDKKPLDSSDGVIIPQGIFEVLKSNRDSFGVSYNVQTHKDLLLHREREISNLNKNGKWVCFIVGEIIDSVRGGQYGMETLNIRDTDLCKKVLNGLRVQRNAIKGNPHLQCKVDEFRKFVEKYGVAKTSFEVPDGKNDDYKILVELDNMICGFEYQKKIFFIPAHILDVSNDKAFEIASELSEDINDYITKRQLEVPVWLSEISFSQEKLLSKNLYNIHKKEVELTQELNQFRIYKAILTTSGDILHGLISKILREYFSVNIDSSDDYKEDIKVLDKNNEIAAFIEVKGTKKGIKREYINQVDSHKERAEVPCETPGILIINNEMSVEGFENRMNTIIASEQIIHAKKNNILIVRTIDLLNLMILLEKNPGKKEIFLDIVLNNSGWLKVESNKYDIIEK